MEYLAQPERSSIRGMVLAQYRGTTTLRSTTYTALLLFVRLYDGMFITVCVYIHNTYSMRCNRRTGCQREAEVRCEPYALSVIKRAVYKAVQYGVRTDHGVH